MEVKKKMKRKINKLLYLLTILVFFVSSFSVDGLSQEQYEFALKWSVDGDPAGIEATPDGYIIYVVPEFWGHRVQKYTADGKFILQWGGLTWPRGVAVDVEGNVYVADTWAHRVQKFDSNGMFITRWGSWGFGDGQFVWPEGIAVDSSGRVYVASYNNYVQVFTSEGRFLYKWGGWGTGDGQFYSDLTGGFRAGPLGIAIDESGNVYVADQGNHRIQVFTLRGEFIRKWGSYGSGDGQFKAPWDVAIDSQKRIYVTDVHNHRVQVFSEMGEFITKFGGYGTGDGQLISPMGITVDSLDNVYVSDSGNHRVQKFRPVELIVQAVVNIDPDTLNLVSEGKWITGYIELPSGYEVKNINVSSILLNGQVKAEAKPTEIGDYDNDGIADLMVKFDRSAVEKVVSVGDKVTITVSGSLTDGKKFEGTDTIRVISPSTLVDNESDIESTKPENFPEPSAVQFYQMAPGQRVNALGQNYPNPFNPATTIEYSIAQDCQVTLKLYNVAGQLVATLVDEWQTAGPHKVVFDAGDKLSRGIYYYQLKAGDFVGTKKMVVLK